MSKFNRDDLKRKFEEFRNRIIYRELSAEIIANIPDDKIEQAIIDYLLTKINDFQNALALVTDLSQGFQIIYSTWILEGEVNNGGFNQFFYNSSGRFADMALQSLKTLGATELYEIMRKAIGIHLDEKENQKLQNLYSQRTIDSFFKTYEFSSLDECDNAFYKSKTNLSNLRIAYIRSHASEFIGD